MTSRRDPDFRTSPTMSPEIADFRVGPKSGELLGGPLSYAGRRRSAQLVSSRLRFRRTPPLNRATETSEKRAAGIQ